MKTALPDEMQTKRDAGINVDYTISEYNSGVVINKGESPVVKLTSGKLYKATIKLNSTKNRNYLALRCPIPSGASIVDESLANSRTVINDDSDYSFSRQAIMDNEMQYFWNNLYPGQNTVSFVFRAERRGVYPVPPVLSECMYTPEIYGRSDGYLFVIE